MMNKNFLIQITNELYRLTLLFPKKEPLRYKMRELADDILARLISISQDVQENPCGKKATIVEILPQELEILDNFFEVAKNQNWVKSEDLLNLQKEYSKLKEEFQIQPHSSPPLLAKVSEKNLDGQSTRQRKILEILKEKGRAQVGDIKKIFSEVTKRTLRRDFKDLLEKGTIERLGERNETFYRIKLTEGRPL